MGYMSNLGYALIACAQMFGREMVNGVAERKSGQDLNL